MLDIVSRRPEGAALRDILMGQEEANSVVTPVRVFEATLSGLAAMGPVLLVADDLHWMDDTTLALCHYVVRGMSAASGSMVLVGASRSAPATSRLIAGLEHLLGTERFRAIPLRPLEKDHGIRLAKDLSPGLGDASAEAVWVRANGSPFWIERLSGGQGDSGDGVAHSLMGPLEAVSSDGSRLLAFVVLVDRALSFDELEELLAWSPKRVSEAVADLSISGLVVGAGGKVKVAHDLVGQAAIASLPSRLRRQTHRRLATWLEEDTDGSGGSALIALEHRVAGGLAIEDAALKLARSTTSRSLGQTGIRHLFSISGDAPFQSRELADALAHRAAEAGDHRLAFDLWSRLASQSADPAAASAALAASEMALVLQLNVDAWDFLVVARRLQGLDEVLGVELDAQESALYRWLARDIDKATTAAQRALNGADRLADADSPASRRAILKATLAATDAALMAGDPARMLKLSEQLERASVEYDEPLHVRALAEGALAMRLLGHNREAEQRARLAWEEAKRRVLPQISMEVGPLLARILLSLGKLDEAKRVVDEYVALGDRLADYRPARAFQVVVPSMLLAATGDWRAAVDLLETAAASEAEPHYRLQAHMERAALLARHDPERSATSVKKEVASSFEDAAQSGCHRCQAEVTARSAEALARIGEVQESATQFDSDHGDRNLRWFRLVAIAASAATAEAATKAWEAAYTEADQQDLNLEALRNRVDLARLLAGIDRTRAAELAREAGASAARMGALTEERAAERILRSLGVRTWQRGTGRQGQVLTDREHQIAGMIGAGASNPEIAEALFLSRKTVERHVSNILAKLGVRNRAELAGVVGTDTPP
jgi:DNA-binding CsgD family transcriptional regulator